MFQVNTKRSKYKHFREKNLVLKFTDGVAWRGIKPVFLVKIQGNQGYQIQFAEINLLRQTRLEIIVNRVLAINEQAFFLQILL